MNKTKIIYDLIHGYIEINKNIEPIINCESFQRLKFINQLTAQHLYPSANHTRFEHSLGVMHLAFLFFERIESSLQEILDKKTKELFPPDDIEFLKNHLLYAALLHDVGHAPLSHVGEKFYNKDEIIEEIKKVHLKRSLPENIDFFKKSGSEHEIMSCYIIIKVFKDIIDKIYSKINYEFIYRIIVGAKYKKDEYPERNAVISIINSDTFDVDKLDYLLRDNYMTGKVGPEIDIARLLIALTINDDNEIAFTHSALSALQKIIDCRDNIYMWVCNHHTVVYTDYLYQECFKHFNNLSACGSISGKIFTEALPYSKLFSCEAISEKCVDDNDALHYIKKAMWSVKEGKCESSYTKIIVTQLENRNYLKPTWKTLFEFDKYLRSIKDSFDDKKQKKILKYVTENIDNRKNIVKYICKELGIELGNLFIVDRKNKFYCEKMDSIYIIFNDKEEKLSDLLPARDYKKLYDGVAFYIFCENEKREIVKSKFIDYFKNNPDVI
jgi:HD superfamily phosphohydrolase